MSTNRDFANMLNQVTKKPKPEKKSAAKESPWLKIGKKIKGC